MRLQVESVYKLANGIICKYTHRFLSQHYGIITFYTTRTFEKLREFADRIKAVRGAQNSKKKKLDNNKYPGAKSNALFSSLPS
jgi:hypothetical protein